MYKNINKKQTQGDYKVKIEVIFWRILVEKYQNRVNVQKNKCKY